MTANIMKVNGEVVHWSTYHGLKEDKWKNQAHISLRKDFDSKFKDGFKPDVSPDDFPDVNLEDTPLYNMYEYYTKYVEGNLAGNTKDDEETDMANVLDCKVPTPDSNENYVNALVMLPTGNSYSRRKVIKRKVDADGNTIGRKNDNPIINTMDYRV